MSNGTQKDWITRAKRLLRLRMIVPILRARERPHHTARGVYVGLLTAMTPTVGIQMMTVLALWWAAKLFWPRLSFNLVVGMIWTGITNLLTLPPFYYLFLVTGKVMMGQWDALNDYDAFAAELQTALAMKAGFFESLYVYMVRLFENYGLPMFVGCIPWAIGSSWLGYVWTLRLLRKFKEDHRRRFGSVLDREP